MTATSSLKGPEALASQRARYAAMKAEGGPAYARKLAGWRANNARDRKERPELYLLKSARGRAKRRGLECTIAVTDIVFPAVCPVLGIPLAPSQTRTFHESSPSLDRRDPAVGYVPGNVFVISYRANRMKSDGTPDELLAVARYAAGGAG